MDRPASAAASGADDADRTSPRGPPPPQAEGGPGEPRGAASPAGALWSSTPREPSLRTAAPPAGRIELIFGPMFAGKSTELMRRIRRHRVAGRSTLLLKYAGDTRYEEVAAEAVVSHDKAALAALSATTLAGAAGAAAEASVIGVDEGQFFPDLVETAEAWANAGKIVIVAALDATFQRTPFGGVLALVPRAEAVCKLTAVCHYCKADASFTLRHRDGATAAPETAAVELIGGAESYYAVCRGCHADPPQALTTTPPPAAAAAGKSALAAGPPRTPLAPIDLRNRG